MKIRKWACVAVIPLASVACNSSTGPNGNGGSQAVDVIVLNSLSKTIQKFGISNQTLTLIGPTINLPANFDGVAFDFIQDLFVTTTSSFGGSQIIFGALSTGEQIVTSFPGATASLADAGKPTLVTDAAGTVGALVPARARNSVYIAFPGQATAQLLASDVGEFVERALPFGAFVLTVDANLDDAGGTWEPLGPPRLALHSFITGEFFDEVVMNGAVGGTEALIFQSNLIFLAGGGLDQNTFLPEGDGALASINVTDRGIRDIFALGGNGLAMEAGRNGLVYIVRSKGAGTLDTDVLTFNFSTRNFERGPSNPIQPKDSDGSNLSCRVVSARLSGQMLCLTFEQSAQGRIVLLDVEGGYIDDAPIGAGATDIGVIR